MPDKCRCARCQIRVNASSPSRAFPSADRVGPAACHIARHGAVDHKQRPRVGDAATDPVARNVRKIVGLGMFPTDDRVVDDGTTSHDKALFVGNTATERVRGGIVHVIAWSPDYRVTTNGTVV